MSSLDNAFTILKSATRIEKSGSNPIEAATKYYEAVYLMKQHLLNTPQTKKEAATRALIEEKCAQYTEVAVCLLASNDNKNGASVDDPRSPLASATFPDGGFSNRVSDQSDYRTRHLKIVTDLANEANILLSRAIDLDQAGKVDSAIETYMSSSEKYLKAIKITKEGPGFLSVTPMLSRRLEGALDRVEVLKGKGKVLPVQSKTLSAAPESRPTGSPLTKEEIDTLKRSSLIASGLFLPWSEPDAQELSERARKLRTARSVTMWTDKDGDLPLSQKQQKRFFRWARPHEIVKQRKGTQAVMIREITPYSIRQQYVTDCSFIASLCICAAFERRFRKSLVTSLIYPQENGIPIVNPEGKYTVKLWLNGVARQVTVDDRLPVDRHLNLLCSQTSNTECLELWVSIIEKAYMKLMGSYDFPGSNSGVDLFSLTGWIPERLFFAKDTNKVRDFETLPERAWERLLSANSFGDCLITASTTKEISEAEADRVGLVTGHAYAVLDVVQTQRGLRILKLKNPWAHQRWKGRFSSYDKMCWRDIALRKELGYDPEQASRRDDGVFWIEWTDMQRYFQNIQMSWNPALFAHRYSTHGYWPRDLGPDDDTFNVGENPQYILSLSNQAIKEGATIWILLSRHITKQEQEGNEVADFLTVHLVRNNTDKERIWFPQSKNTLANGAYTNNPHVLIRYDVSSPDEQFISLVLSQHKKNQDLGFSLSCFSTQPFSFGRPKPELPYSNGVEGAWTPSSASGPPRNDSFYQNPMFFLSVPSKCKVQAQASTNGLFAVNLMVFPLVRSDADPKNCRKLMRKNGNQRPIVDSGSYRHGFTITAKSELRPGLYVLVVSTYTPGQTGPFKVKLTSSVKLALLPVS